MNSPEPFVPKPSLDGRAGLWSRMLEAQRRERNQLTSELSQIRDLMPLLMKRRNGQRWTRAERQRLQAQLRAVAHLSPYLVVLALPGSFALIPVLAWWLDRRRGKRSNRPMANA